MKGSWFGSGVLVFDWLVCWGWFGMKDETREELRRTILDFEV